MADAKNKSEQPKVIRLKANGSKTTDKKRVVKAAKNDSPKNHNIFMRIIGGFFGYFKGAWFELRQVRWPNRRATWGMTGALLGFTAFFIVFILSVDVVFENLFKLILR